MAAPQAFFYIKSKLNQMVMDISGQSGLEGSKIHMWEKHGFINQIWYEDHQSGTIRTRMNNLCLSINGNGQLAIETFQPGKYNQMWELGGGTVRHRSNKSVCLEIHGSNHARGAGIVQAQFSGSLNQLWEFDYIQVPKRNYYFIKSKLNNMCLDISEYSLADGAKVHMWDKSGAANQMWYEDTDTGTIRSRTNDKCLTINAQGKLVMESWKGLKNQQLEPAGNTIRNKQDKHMVLDIEGENRSRGASICLYSFKGSPNQLWEFDYISPNALFH